MNKYSMHCSLIPKFKYLKLHVVFVISLFLIPSSLSDPRITESGLYCDDNKRTASSNFIPTFTKEMETLTQIITTNHFATNQQILLPTTNATAGSPTTTTTTTSTIYALAQCHEDLSQTDCLLCYTEARTKLPRCIPSLSGRIFLDGCFLRYDNYSFYNESVSKSYDSYNCSTSFYDKDGPHNSGSDSSFVRSVGHAIGNASNAAVKNGGFGALHIDGVYALGQCWDSVSRLGCEQCLEKAAMEVKRCAPKREGRGMNVGCYLRYSTEKFYGKGVEDEHNDDKKYIVAIVLATFAFLMLSCFAAYFLYKRVSKKKKETRNLGLSSMSFHKSRLKYKYETLEKATEYFSGTRKIGQGGSGSVFVGVLPDGKTVAVKRLIFNTRQWVDDFFNEVNLISGIQHKNLVKLLGCSIEGPESLLVYEYIPYGSLDRFIFGSDEKKNNILNWKQRYNIIVGTAEGLAYLHGGCETRIIHRDIKSSNILLDDDFNPKIADFGLVRGFALDKSHLSTGVAGTLGYMAPEYLVRGQLTEKADVYSFGVLVLEIVCGRRNNTLTQDSGSLLQSVWNLYGSNNLSEAVDPCLNHEFSVEEASNVLQIGLLCTQASVSLRPSMENVVSMLTKNDGVIPQPNQPPFLNGSVLRGSSASSSSTITYNSTNSLVSNVHTKIVMPYTSSETSGTQSFDGQSRSGDLTRK